MADDILKNIWPEWQIVKRLGQGSYGVVYEAVREDYDMESRAAVKVISVPQSAAELDSLSADGLTEEQSRTFLRNIVDEFVHEIKLMKQLQGAQNVVVIEDYKVIESKTEIHWDIYVRMELLLPLAKYMSRWPEGLIPQSEAIRLGIDICRALEVCERFRIIHRDIKPENILYHEALAQFKLGDFGVARRLEGLTTSLSVKGTPNYMAPEVYNGRKYDERADLYSLGLVLHRLTNRNSIPFAEPGRRLLTPEERNSAMQRRMNGEALPAPADASPELAEVILRASAFDPAARYGSAKEMREALERVQNGTYALKNAPKPSKPEPTPEPVPEPVPEPTDGRTIPVNPSRETKDDDKTLPIVDPEAGDTVALDWNVVPGPDEEKPKKPAEEKPNQNNTKKLLAIVLAVVLVAGLGAGVVWRMKGKNEKPVSAGATAAPTAEVVAEVTVEPTDAPTPVPTAAPTATPTNVPFSAADWEYELDGSGYTITKYNGTDKEVTIPDMIDGTMVTSIGKDAFTYCSGLTSITIPSSVTSIGSFAFYLCSDLTSITIPNSVTSIGGWAFYNCSRLISIAIPDSVTSIGDYTFYGCRGLTSITIPDSVTSIGNNAFHNCSGLTSITISNSVTSIGDDTFNGCDRLTNVAIPGGVTSIGSSAFNDCSSLTSITIPDSVTSIGYDAFSHCGSLSDVYYSGSQSDWQKIDIQYDHYLTSASIHYNAK